MVLLVLYIFLSLMVIGPSTAQDATSLSSFLSSSLSSILSSSAPSSGGINHVSITYADAAIRTVSFSTQNDPQLIVLTNVFAGPQGSKAADQFDVDTQVEKIKTISGTLTVSGAFGIPITVTSVSFTTDKNKTFGPFGFPTGFPFSFDVNDQITDWVSRFGRFFMNVLMPKSHLSVGPWGSQDPGNLWTYQPTGVIAKINITYGDVIYSLSFTSQDDMFNLLDSPTYGLMVGNKSAEIIIDTANEKLNYISGTYGFKNGFASVTSLSLTTDANNTFGPYGTPNGTAFSLQAHNESFIGFHGRSGSWLDAIGIYLPREQQSLGRWGSQIPGNEWSYAPQGSISHISLTYDNNVIHTITITSTDGNGNLTTPQTFGLTTGANSSEIAINIGSEKLNSISGTTNFYSGYYSVTSLSFATNKNRTFGPFGLESGTAFSARVNDGVIGGFYGRAGSWLDAIGIIVQPTN